MLAIDRERGQLLQDIGATQAEIEGLRATVENQAARIRELEESVVTKRTRSDTNHDRLRRANVRSIRVVRGVRDRTENLVTERAMMAEDLVDAAISADQEKDPSSSSVASYIRAADLFNYFVKD